MLDSLKIGDMHATALLALASEFEVFEGDIPETPKDRLSEAHDLVSFAIDSKSEIDDKEVEAQIDAILAVAGVTIEEDIISYGDAPERDELEEMLSEHDVEVELPESDAEDDNGDGDGEAAFDVDDIIDGWSSMKIKEAKEALAEAAELEGKDELEFEEVQNLLAWENEQDKPRTSVVKAIEALLEEFEDATGGEEEGSEDEEPEAAAEEDNGGEEKSEDGGTEIDPDDYEDEPYDGYDESKVGDIKEVIADEDRTVEELEYILNYERINKDRSTITRAAEARIEELSEPEGEDEPAEEEKPKGRRRRGKSEDPDESNDADDAVAEDDERDKRKSRRGGKSEATGDFEKNLAPHFKDLISEKNATEQAEKLGLKPKDDEYDEDELPAMPDDIADTDHEDLSNLLMIYTAAHSSASWYAARDYVLAAGYEEVADYYEDSVLEESDAKNKEAREAESKTDDRVVYFRSRQKKHYQNYVVARDARNDIKRRIETISRVGGFKVDDDDASDQGSKSRRTRKRS